MILYSRDSDLELEIYIQKFYEVVCCIFSAKHYSRVFWNADFVRFVSYQLKRNVNNRVDAWELSKETSFNGSLEKRFNTTFLHEALITHNYL